MFRLEHRETARYWQRKAAAILIPRQTDFEEWQQQQKKK